MQDFHRLKVWEKSHRLAMDIYNIAGGFPRSAGLALTSQLRRSALSIPTNIAEGAGRPGSVEFRRFLQIAMGSASETKYHLVVARDLQFINEATFDDLSERISEIRRMTTGLMKRIATRTGSAEPTKSDGLLQTDADS